MPHSTYSTLLINMNMLYLSMVRSVSLKKLDNWRTKEEVHTE